MDRLYSLVAALPLTVKPVILVLEAAPIGMVTEPLLFSEPLTVVLIRPPDTGTQEAGYSILGAVPV